MIQPPNTSDGAKQLAAVGYDKLDLGFTFAGSYDPATKVYALSDLTLRGVDAGSFGVKAQLDGIEKSVLSGPQSARMIGLFGAGVSSIELRFVNAGLVEKTLTYFAKEQGKSAEDIYEGLAVADVQAACDLFKSLYDSHDGMTEKQRYRNSLV